MAGPSTEKEATTLAKRAATSGSCGSRQSQQESGSEDVAGAGRVDLACRSGRDVRDGPIQIDAAATRASVTTIRRTCRPSSAI